MREQEAENSRRYLAAAGGLLTDLHAAGIHVEDVGELREPGVGDRRALPILLKWLPQITYRWLKIDVIATLSCRWAQPEAAPALVAEFRRIDPATDPEPTLGIRMAIGDALERVATESVIEDLIAIATDRDIGPHRAFIVASLGKMRRSRDRVIPLLIDLLDDETVAGYALIALRRLKAMEAKSRIEPMVSHPNDWVREQARKAVTKLDA